jgi:hypothetical protein
LQDADWSLNEKTVAKVVRLLKFRGGELRLLSDRSDCNLRLTSPHISSSL